jgi:hypothetical protein
MDTNYLAVLFSPIAWYTFCPKHCNFLNSYVGAKRVKGVPLCGFGFCCARSGIKLLPNTRTHAIQLTVLTKDHLWSILRYLLHNHANCPEYCDTWPQDSDWKLLCDSLGWLLVCVTWLFRLHTVRVSELWYADGNVFNCLICSLSNSIFRSSD